jgi:hypothetical protein
MAEFKLAQSVSVLKSAKQQETLGYLFLLKRLAYLSLQTGNYTQSEQLFQECVDLVPSITSSPVNLFQAQRNLVLAYCQFDVVKASYLVEEMCLGLDRNVASIDFGLILGNVEFYNNQIASAKKIYRTCLTRLHNEPC